MASFISSFPRSGRGLHRISSCETRFRMQTPDSSGDRKITLYGTSVSNYMARCRFLVKRKNLSEHAVSVKLPSELGGLKSEQYLKLNPLGKMPLAVVRDGQGEKSIFESSVICEYLAEVFSHQPPSFIPETPEGRAKARLIANILDVYIGPHHPFMYKKLEGDRESEVKKMLIGFDALEHELDSQGPYVTGNQLSTGDCCLWGNWPFYDFMLPTFFGWHPTEGRPKLAAWREHMLKESQAARDVYAEVFMALHGWWDSGRWDNLSMKPLTPRPNLPF